MAEATHMILLTGGTGYIGSHTAVELISAGYSVHIIDNLCNSKLSALDRIEKISGKRPGFSNIDIRDRTALCKLFSENPVSAVVHFAGLKAVGESVSKPLDYYDNNVAGSLTLFECMAEAGLKNLVFSSSATVYGDPASVPIHEAFPLSATNPYGRTKLIIEEMLRDIALSDPRWRIALLRYFNPVGAHKSGLLGEDPNGTPNNLMPYIAQVAAGKRRELPVYGSDYPTPDGTGIRDYIHVVDLARGHLAAINKIQNTSGITTVNLGTGRGYSVLEMINAFANASGREIPYKIVGRRAGDIAKCFADPTLAQKLLGWEATLGINEMCEDTWRWQQWASTNLSQ
jgi:UDP-glucose 4-epimerase